MLISRLFAPFDGVKPVGKVPSYQSFLDRRHFALLDGIRGFAILAVLWHHSNGSNPFDHAIFERGYLGVDLFFVLSGFLITHLLIKEKRVEGSISLRNFYVRRSLRIFPLYYTYLFASLGWMYISSPDKFFSIIELIPYYLLYWTNWIPDHGQPFFTHSWSLSVEEQFYLLWPMLFLLLGLRSAKQFVAGVLISSVVGLLFLGANELPELVGKLVPYRTLLIGCLLALLLNNEASYKWFSKICSSRQLPLLLLLLVGLIIGGEGPIVGFERLGVHLLMMLFVASAVVNENNSFAGFFRFRPLQFIGVVSYGIYILHGQLWGIAYKISHALPLQMLAESRVVFFIALLVLSAAVAYISYRFFENRFLQLKHRFYQKAGSPKLTDIDILSPNKEPNL